MELQEKENPPYPETCVHHWIIDTANGPASLGVCEKCGDEKEFKNSPRAAWWY